MKTQVKVIALGIVGILTIASCRKEAGVPSVQENATEKTTSPSATDQNILSPSSSYKILGSYSLRGSRTKYDGQANENGDNITVIYDYFGERKLITLQSEKALTCGYCSDGYANDGWKYTIRYNLATNQILLSPNDIMAAAIKPNSFKQLAAVYSAAYGSFTFQTRYTDQDGNENEVIDILNKE